MGFDGGVDAAVAALLDAPLTCLDDDGLLERVREVESARRRLAALDHRLICELEVRSVAARRLQRGTAGLLSAVLHLDRTETRRRVAAAAELGPRTGLDGTPLDPVLPATAAAQARGEISTAHATVVSDTMRALPSSVPAGDRERAEAQLAEQATHLLPTELARSGERIVAHLDPDGRLTDDTDRARRRGVTIGTQGQDGMSSVRGLLTPAARAALDAALAVLAKPDPARDGSAGGDGRTGDGSTGDGSTGEAGPVRDPRTPAQRTHDGLAALAELAMASGTVGAARGTPATMVVTLGLDDLERRAGRATTATGGRLSVPEALDLAADASWVLLVLDRRGQPLWLSRSTRLATRGQRHALLARDGGCTRPGCDAPAAWCEAHHLTEWQDGGPTDIDNLALVCPYDHHLITSGGFTVELDDEQGRVTWTAPAWLDPDQTPRVNGVHRTAPGTAEPPPRTDGGDRARPTRHRRPSPAARRLQLLLRDEPPPQRPLPPPRLPICVGFDPPAHWRATPPPDPAQRPASSGSERK